MKRSRVTYDRDGGQTPNISPDALSMFAAGNVNPKNAAGRQAKATNENHGLRKPPTHTCCCHTASDGSNAEETDERPDNSLTTWLLGKAGWSLFGL